MWQEGDDRAGDAFCPTLISDLGLGLDEQRLRSHSSVRPGEKWSLWLRLLNEG